MGDLLDKVTGANISKNGRADMAKSMANRADLQHTLLMKKEGDTKDRRALVELSQKLKNSGNKQATDSLAALAFGTGKPDPYDQFADNKAYGDSHPDMVVGHLPNVGNIRHGDIVHHAMVIGKTPESLMQDLLKQGFIPNTRESSAGE